MLFKRITAAILTAALTMAAFTGLSASAKSTAADKEKEVRGVWLSVYDYGYSGIGLSTDSETVFRKNADRFISRIKQYKLNTIYMQVRSNDDAAWRSSTFPAMKELSPYVSSLARNGKNTAAAKKTLKFDPLSVMTEEAHKNDVDLIAWMNPYRCYRNNKSKYPTMYFLDPQASGSINRVVKAVNEVMAYGVDGVVFDDYFYHSTNGYWNDSKKKVTLSTAQAAKLPRAKKAANVNKLVRKVYSAVKARNKNATFGISPQGNLDNDMASGADVKTWASVDGYVDYIMPQIYWTDDYGKKGGTTMFSDRLSQFTSKSLDKKGKIKYIALALYRCGYANALDQGWKSSDTNLADQYEALKEAGCKGYSLFSARFIYIGKAEDELGYLNESIVG